MLSSHESAPANHRWPRSSVLGTALMRGEHLSNSTEDAQEMSLEEGVCIIFSPSLDQRDCTGLPGRHVFLLLRPWVLSRVRAPEEEAWRTRAHLRPTMRYHSTLSVAGHASSLRAPAPEFCFFLSVTLGWGWGLACLDLERDSADGVPLRSRGGA